MRRLFLRIGLSAVLVVLSLGHPTSPARADPVTVTAETCFTPGQDCQGFLISLITHTPAAQHIYVQAYSFTSAPLGKALTQAHKRGVRVVILLDHSQLTERYSSATFFAHAGIPLAIDSHEAIAHNKVMIFPEQRLVVTGSFNFTKSAQERNAENLVFLSGSPDLVQRYLDNFVLHWQHSRAFPSPSTTR